MKKIETSLNEKEYERFTKKAGKKGISLYAYLKALVLKDLNDV
jgi:hypothetical protein